MKTIKLPTNYVDLETLVDLVEAEEELEYFCEEKKLKYQKNKREVKNSERPYKPKIKRQKKTVFDSTTVE